MLTTEFNEGFNCADAALDNPYIWSSDAWLAFMAGADFARRGTSAPTKARKSRGNVIRAWTAGGTEWRIEYDAHYNLRRVARVD